MKKLLTIVASVLTLGAFAADNDITIQFVAPDGASAEKAYTVVETTTDTTVEADLDFGCLPYYIVATIAAEDYPTAGTYALAENGIILSESVPMAPMSAPRLAGLKLAGEEGAISYDESQKAVVYISDASYEKVIVESGTVTFGHDGSGYAKANFPANSTVEVKKDAVAALTRWGGAVNGESISGGGDYTINLDGITLTGDGVFKVIKPSDTVAAIVNGTIHGDGTIEFEDIATEINKQDHPLVFANDWTGTIKLPLIDTVAGNNPAHNLGRYGTDKSKVAISGIGGGWLTRGINVKSALVLEGNMKITDWSQDTYKFAAIEGSGDFTVVKEGNYAPNSVVIEKIDASKYSGTIKADVNLTIGSLETSLEAIPADKTKVVSLAEGTDTSKITVTVKLADGTAIDSDKISVESDGVYVLAPAVPGIDLIPEDQKTGYPAWLEANITTETTLEVEDIAAAFLLGATVSEGVTIEDAAQAKVKELLKDIDLSALATEGEDAALETLNAELEEKGLVASLKPVTLDGASESTKLYTLVITLKTEN